MQDCIRCIKVITEIRECIDSRKKSNKNTLNWHRFIKNVDCQPKSSKDLLLEKDLEEVNFYYPASIEFMHVRV